MPHYSACPRVPAALLHRSLTIAVLASAAAVAQAQDQDHAKLGELVSTYCTECHNFEDYSGGLDLESFDFSHIGDQAKVGEAMIRKLSAGVMPPPGKPRPKPEEQKMLVDGLVSELDKAWEASPTLMAPGIHRMNRAEYANAVSELLNLEIDPAALLPVDDTSYGFDNMAGSLGSSPALIEAYVSAAAKISRLALGLDLETTRKEYHSPPDFSQNRHVPGLPFGSRGGLLAEHNFPADGNYTFNWTPVRSNAGGLFGDSVGETLELTIDGELIHSWDVANENPRNMADERYVATVPVTAGPHRVGLSFVARTHMPSDDFNKKFERTTLTQDVVGFTFAPHVNALSITGPFEATRPEHTASRDKVFSCYPENADQETACAEQILTALGTQAYRRPVTKDDTDLLMQFFEAGRAESGDFETGIQRSLQLILADPEFIYRSETDPGTGDGPYYAISDLELASRLSFFLWSSPPDAELLEIAEAGKLRDGDTLEQQVKRMLNDPRSSALTQNFAAQWLQLRNLASAAPVADLFPDFDDNLRQAFRTETELLFESIMREDRDVGELLDANYTFLNERLAKHYGIPNVYGSNFRRVDLPPEFDARRGLLGKGSVLTVASVADRTSTVRRGKWVLLNILGVIPPEPPPNVPALEASTDPAAAQQTMRERMSQHASNPACASCHQIMDPIGFALESFDATGKQRSTEFGRPMDLSGKLVDGQTFNGPSELREALMKYKPQFVQTVAERLLTYGLGRGVEYYDMPVVRDIVRKAEQDNDSFSSLILGVVESQPFQMNQRQVSSLAAQ
jgi:cytochrome c553